ncbi:MAG: hypothetical protein ACRBF0_07345 [Calditrichia bacterium]
MGFSNNFPKLLVVFAVAAVAIVGMEMATAEGTTSMLYTMLFFVAVSMGPIAIMAAVDVCESDWAKPYKREMLSTHHMILFIALLFGGFVLLGKLNVYGWAAPVEGLERKWLNTSFFTWRNLALLLISWVVASTYAKVSLNDGKRKVMWAIFYIFAYVITQTMVAFDWVMSLEFPWLSTLFGAYFFVEAFYSGLALAAIFTFFLSDYYAERYPVGMFKKSQMDMMTMMFGFSIFWAYQFFSQLIVIWYGNIPEEVSFFTTRLDLYGYTLFAVILILFITPFWVLMSRKVKANPKMVMIMGFVIWGGILLERFFMIHHHVQLNWIIVIPQFLIAALVFVLVIRSRGESESLKAS